MAAALCWQGREAQHAGLPDGVGPAILIATTLRPQEQAGYDEDGAMYSFGAATPEESQGDAASQHVPNTATMRMNLEKVCIVGGCNAHFRHVLHQRLGDARTVFPRCCSRG